MARINSVGHGLLPREQMLNAVRAEEVPSESLLAILLKTGAPGCDVCELFRRLLDCFGSVAALVRCDWRTLAEKVLEYNRQNPSRQISGLGKVKMLELAAAFELVRRGYEHNEEDVRKIVVNSPSVAADLFWRQIRGAAPWIRRQSIRARSFERPFDGARIRLWLPIITHLVYSDRASRTWS